MGMSSDSDKDNLFTGQMDPEIADLIGVPEDEETAQSPPEGKPDFTDLFEEERDEDVGESAKTDLSVKTFKKPAQIEQKPQPYFKDKNYYKTVLIGEGEISKRVHSTLGAFLNAEDPQDRSMQRGRLIPAYWELMRSIASKIHTKLPMPKVLAVRYGALLPTIISASQREIISKIVFENNTGEPVHYADEWLKAVAYGRVNASATDETKTAGRSDAQRINALLEKTQGKFDAQLSLIQGKMDDLEAAEENLAEQVRILSTHDTRPDLNGLKLPYNETQRSALTEISNLLRRIGSLNKEVGRYFNELENIQDQLDMLKEKDEESEDASSVDSKVVVEEYNTVRQMAKLCVGRQGNHFPILMKQYFRDNILDIATRENIINVLIQAEYLDPGIFLRTYKQQTNRIVPNIILVPCYGDQGVCWEPFERFNRSTSRGRLAIPMYPKDLRTAVISALGDLRWQIAKEKAQHYWMEEGLTGWYYQWFTDRKMKGDVKDAFIQDYILWLNKESEGTQKLDREVRGIFWRYIPFPQEIKDKLKNRGFVYSELYKKDQNRSMSDGY